MQELEGELRVEKQAHQADSKRAEELGIVASRLQEAKKELEQESASLKADKAQLLQRAEALGQQQVELRQSAEAEHIAHTAGAGNSCTLFACLCPTCTQPLVPIAG